MQFLKNEDLEMVLPDWKGNPFHNNEFQYVGKSFRAEYSTVLRYLARRNPQAKEKKSDNWRPSVHRKNDYLRSDEDFIVWLGHATFLIQLNGVRMITDPVFYDLPLLKRFVRIPFDISDLANVDFVLLSHDHRDHCDEKSLKSFFKHNNSTILTSLKMTDVINSWVGNNVIQEAGWYQKYALQKEGIEIIYLPAQHWCRRGLTDFNRRLWGSFLIKSEKRTIYFGGDSASGSHFAEIGTLFQEIDIAILGIGAYKPEFMMKENHASPSEAKEAFDQLGAKQMIPMHYGTYDLSSEPISEPYHLIQQSFSESNEPEKLILPGINEVVYLG